MIRLILEKAGILAHHRLSEGLGARGVEHPEAFGDLDEMPRPFVWVSTLHNLV